MIWYRLGFTEDFYEAAERTRDQRKPKKGRSYSLRKVIMEALLQDKQFVDNLMAVQAEKRSKKNG